MDSNRKILIVDDQEDLRQQVAKMLQHRAGQSDTSSLIEQIRSRISKTKETAPAAAPRIQYQVDTVGQGRDAYEMVKESFSKHEPYALMFLDMRMPPGWDGLETAQRIRSIDKEIQIVIMTAYADYEQQEIAEKIGEPDKLLYIKKPFHSEEIRQLALAMTEKWNMNRREKERLILTNRLMRENSYLTRYRFKNIQDTYRTVLDAFVSFLDARSGVLVRRHGENHTPCAATTPDDGKRLPAELDSATKDATKVITSESRGTAFFPVSFEGFDGYIFVEGKNLVFPFEQLRPFLDILLETTREVLINSSLHQQQSEERQLAAIGLATSKISSRVNDAMALITAATSEIRGSDDTVARGAVCDKIDAAAEAVLRLTREVQIFSDEQHESLELEKFNTKDLITQSLQRFEEQIMEQGIAVVTELESDLVITCDGDAIGRCFDTLIQNAVDAFARSTREQKELKISAAYLNNYRNAVQITIQDNAGGIPEGVLGHVFEPFRSSDPEHRNGLGGTIAKQILDRHNGTLSYESEAGEGSTFQVVLPVSPDTPISQSVSGKLT